MEHSGLGKKSVLLLYFITVFTIAPAQQKFINKNEELSFHRITTEQGLPHDIINCIEQDRKGFIWIGTNNGLCRYEGNTMINYLKNAADSLSISDNNIQSIRMDSRQRLWIGTYWKGLNLLDEKNNRFIHLNNDGQNKNLLVNNSIYSLEPIDSTHLAIAQGELVVIDVRKNKSFIVNMPENSWSDRNLSISRYFSPYKIFIDHANQWWLCGEAGIVRYNPGTKLLTAFCNRRDVPESIKNHSSWDCAEDQDGNIWIAGGAGLFQYDPKTDKFSEHYPGRFASADCQSLFLKSVLCAKDGSIWFGSTNGLFHYSPREKSYSVYRFNPYQSSSVSNNDINCLYQDRQGIIWVGTQNGLNVIYPEKAQFKTYQHVPGNPFTIASNNTMGSFKDNKGNIWCGTDLGLDCISVNGKVEHYTYIDNRINTRNDYSVMPLFQQDEQHFWVGTWGAGMQLFNFGKRKFVSSYVHSDSDSNSICSNFIHSFTKDNQGNIWIATWNGGIDKFDPVRKVFKHYNISNGRSPDNYLNKIIFAYGTIWSGSTKGLLRFDARTNKFQLLEITSDTSNYLSTAVSDFTPVGDGSFLIGSPNGLTKYNSRTGYFQKVISGISIMGMRLQENGSLWMATDNGLQEYNTRNGNRSAYTLKDGLPINNFPNECYFTETKQGELLVNTMNGLTLFHPSELKQNHIPPPVFITSIKVQNKELSGFQGVKPGETIFLSHDQNYINIKFAALNYINPFQNQFAYMLKGFDKDWIYTGNHNEANYTNLPPGNYVFMLKASNDANVWITKPVELKIHINTPWWKTWWFYAICFIWLAGFSYWIHRIRLSRVLAEQKLRNKIARDLHDDIGSTLSGIKLFSNLAHSQLLQEGSEVTPIVKRIGERSERMIDAMSDIVWSINPSNDTLENMLVRMKQYAAEMLEPKNIQYFFSADDQIYRAKIGLTSRRDIYLIFKETINNIVKHANCRSVFIQLSIEGRKMVMTVSDDGVGFDALHLEKGNGLGNLRERAKQIGGTISVHTEREKGTMVRLIVPLT